jgi:PAS domain S-box-containing protein
MMSKLFATLMDSNVLRRRLPLGLSIGFGLTALGLAWVSGFSGLSITLVVILLIWSSGCIWVIDQLIRALRKMRCELSNCRDVYLACAPDNRLELEESLASADYALTIQDLYNNAPCGYHSIDSNGRVVLMNDTELKMLGYDREEIVGRRLFFEFVAPESVGLWMDRFEILKERGWVKDLEINLQHRDGRRFPVLINSTAVRDQDGNYQMSRSTVVDVSQRKRTEHALRQSEAQYRGIVEDQTELICRFLPDGRLTFVNQAYCRYFGVKAEQLLGQSFTPTIPEDDRPYVEEQFSKLSLEHPMVQYEHRVILPNGEVRWHAWTDRAIFDEQGTLIEYQGVGRDISTQYFQAGAVRKLSNALEMAVVGIAEVSPQGRYVQVNDAYAAMCGYGPAELIGEEWWSLIDRKDRTAALNAYQVMMHSNRAEVEVNARRKQGGYFDQKIVLVKAYDQQQQFVGHYCFTQDISARRELDRLKDEFVSIVSHELRTPLTSIAGALDLLASGVLQKRPEQSKRMVAIAAQNTERLVRMINDILDVERIKSGKVVMNCEVCKITDLLQQSIEVMQAMADQNYIQLKWDVMDALVSVDRDRIIQVITNLLSNAIKFSEPHTQVKICAIQLDPQSSVHPAAIHLDEPAILVSVQDQGRGIPEANLTTIFEPFQQVDASDSRQKGGTGLGLAICRSILQQHHSPFWVESQFEKGSTFYFMLPIVPDSSTKEA